MTKTPGTPLTTLRQKHSVALGELERYKVLVESVRDYAIFFMDPTGTILTWNKGAELAKGYKPKEIIGKNFSVFYSRHDKETHKPERELVLARQHGRVEDEDWRIRKDGSKFWANVVITALYNDDHELVGFAKVTRDLTDRKQQEDALRNANILLKQQQTDLKKLNTSKDEFISLASHQLRTPATAVKQLLGMLIEGFYGDIPKELLTVIAKAYESNERQINIVNNLLKVAQLDAGKVTLNREQVKLDKLLANIVEEQRDIFQKRQQTIELKLPPEVHPTLLDPVNLRMALSNLVDNASKYSENGDVVTLELTQRGTESTVCIRDHGVGISLEDQDKLFTKFTRIQNERSATAGGSGLGLYWSKKIIELHGGQITVDSAPAKGSTFKVCLPHRGGASA